MYALLLIELMLCDIKEENESIAYSELAVCSKRTRCGGKSLTSIVCFSRSH